MVSASIMAGSCPACVVDVRDMVCAQALALVSRAVLKARSGQALEVLMNMDDVYHDLIVWSQQQGLAVQQRDQVAGEKCLIMCKP